MRESDLIPWYRLLAQCAEPVDLRANGYLMKLQARFNRLTVDTPVAELREVAKAMRPSGDASRSRDDVTFDIVASWVDKGSPAPGDALPGVVPPVFPPDAELIVRAANLLEEQFPTGSDAEMIGFVAFLMRTVAHERDGEIIQYRTKQLARCILGGVS